MSEFLQVLVAGLAAGGIYGAVAVGFSLLWRTARVINFAQGDVLMVGTFTALTAHESWHLNLGLAVVIGIAAAAVLGIVIELAIFRPLRKVPVWSGIVATLGLSIVLENAALRVFGAAPKAFPSYVGNSTWHWGSVAIDPQSIATIGGCVAMVVLLEVWLRLTTSGRAVRAVAQDGDAARSVGINANRMILAATAVSCAIAGAAGILLGPTTFVSFNMGIPISLLGFSAAIVGGLGSVRGAVIGGLALGVAEQILTSYVSTVYTEALLYAVVVVVLITRPQGLLREAAL